jgi:predicted esterase
MLSDEICYSANVEKVEKAIIMLHGFGSNGEDLISLAPLMQKELSNTIFYAPDAPYKLDFPNSFKWFDIETDASAGVFSHFDYIQSTYLVLIQFNFWFVSLMSATVVTSEAYTENSP